jgi:CHASE3 domain sensor protein
MELLPVFEEKMDTNKKMVLAKLASLQEKIDTRNVESDAHREKMIANQEQTTAKMDACLTEMKDGQKETAACQETMEAIQRKWRQIQMKLSL